LTLCVLCFDKELFIGKLLDSQVYRAGWGKKKNQIHLADITILRCLKMSVNHVMAILIHFIYIQSAYSYS
jgi:hypothetical protein